MKKVNIKKESNAHFNMEMMIKFKILSPMMKNKNKNVDIFNQVNLDLVNSDGNASFYI